MININVYDTTHSAENFNLLFLFETRGHKRKLKAVQYSRLETKSNQIVYNLGFGDYDSKNKRIFDDVVSDNGDVRIVFNTVLSTLPKFFEYNPDIPVYFQGSDSTEYFEEKCRKSCFKNCFKICKNKDRRIRIYSNYLDKNFKDFSKDYIFYGFNPELKIFVDYIPQDKYSAILIYKKK